MGGVVALITLLVVLLSGLTAGLARENTSAVLALPGDEVVFAAPAEGQSPSFAESQIPDGAADLWADTPGVQQVEPLQIRTSRLTVGEDRKSTRLNSSHVAISYAVFCLKKRK